MDAQEISFLLAMALLMIAIPVTLVARAATRGKVSRRSAEVAEELGLRYLGPKGSKADPLFSGVVLVQDDRREVGHVMRGEFAGRSLALADVQVPATIPAVARWGLVCVASAVFGLLGLAGSTLLMMLAPRRVKVSSNPLLIVFTEAMPGLPDFLIEPRSELGVKLEESGRGSPPVEGIRGELRRQYASYGGAAGLLPEGFLERAARVLVGRSNAWTMQGTGGRLCLWISDWRSPTNLRPARSYRSVIDDACSLLDALDPKHRRR